MKKSVKFLLFFATILIVISCRKNDHYVRFQNNYNLQVNSVAVGVAQLGDIAPHTGSAYKRINYGEFAISGSIAPTGTNTTGSMLTGSGSIDDKYGIHKYTVILGVDGRISFSQDK